MLPAEIVLGLMVLTALVTGFFRARLPDPRRLIHISIRVRVAAPIRKKVTPLARELAPTQEESTGRAPRRRAPHRASNRTTSVAMMLLSSAQSVSLAPGSRWG